MGNIASRDDNHVPVWMGVNNVTGLPQEVLVDSNGRVLVSAILSDVTFLDLSDTPSAYTGQGGKTVTVKVDETGLEFTTAGASGANTALSNLASVAINAALVLGTSDAFALGSATKMWSDLFLASGAVVDFNGDITLTHSLDTLTLAGGVLVLPNAGLSMGSSVPFSDSAGTLTLQNVDVLDSTTEATIEAAIDTLANLVSIQGSTFTLTGDFIRSGAHSLTLTTTATSVLTLPSGTKTLVATDVTALTSLGTVSTALTGVLRADSGVLAVDTDVTDLVSAASTTLAGKIEVAIASEVTAGTDATRAVSPDAFAGSDYGIRFVEVQVVEGATNTATGDGQGNYRFIVPAQLNGYNLVVAHASVVTAGTTNTTDIQIANVTDGVDMLSTKITIDSGEKTSYTAATAPVIDTAHDDVATGDELRIDVDAVSTTPAKGLIIILGFQLP